MKPVSAIVTYFRDTDAAAPTTDRRAALLFMFGYLHAKFPDVPVYCAEQDTVTQMPEFVTRIPLAIGKNFAKSTVLNAGVSHAVSALNLGDGDLLLIPDPDTFFEIDGIGEHGDGVMYVPYKAQFRLTKEATAGILQGNPGEFSPDAYYIENQNAGKGIIQGTGSIGVVCLTKKLFFDAGGMDEKFVNHPWDVLNFRAGITRAGGRIVYSEKMAGHFFHDPVKRWIQQ